MTTGKKKNQKKESGIQRTILAYLNSLPDCLAVNNHGSAWQGAGRPDIFASYRGLFVALEVKTDKGKVTPLQLHELEKWKQTGAIVGVVRSVDDVKQLLGITFSKGEAYDKRKTNDDV